MSQLSENLVSYRKAAGLTQQEVADQLGIDRRNYAKYESGAHVPREAVLKKICKILNCSERVFLLGKKQEFFDMLNRYIRNCTLPYDFENALTLYTTFFADWYGEIGAEIYTTICDYTAENSCPAMQAVLQNYSLGFLAGQMRLLCPEKGHEIDPGLWQILEKNDREDLSASQIICFAFLKKTLDFFASEFDGENEVNEQVLREHISKTLQVPTGEDPLFTFAVKVFIPFLYIIAEALENDIWNDLGIEVALLEECDLICENVKTVEESSTMELLHEVENPILWTKAYQLDESLTGGEEVHVYIECSKNPFWEKDHDTFFMIDIFFSANNYADRRWQIGFPIGKETWSKEEVEEEAFSLLEWEIPHICEDVATYLRVQTLWEAELDKEFGQNSN